MCTLPLSAPLHALLTRQPGFTGQKSINNRNLIVSLYGDPGLPSLSPSSIILLDIKYNGLTIDS